VNTFKSVGELLRVTLGSNQMSHHKNTLSLGTNTTRPQPYYIITLPLGFKFNKCLVIDRYSFAHLILSCLGSLALHFLFNYTPLASCLITLILGFVWDLGDGFKPGWWDAPKGTNIWVQELFYADGFSWSDVLIFDLAGCVLAYYSLYFIIH